MGAASGGEGCGVESRFRLMQEPRLSGTQAHRAASDSDAQNGVPEGMASLADRVKAPVKAGLP